MYKKDVNNLKTQSTHYFLPTTNIKNAIVCFCFFVQLGSYKCVGNNILAALSFFCSSKGVFGDWFHLRLLTLNGAHEKQMSQWNPKKNKSPPRFIPHQPVHFKSATIHNLANSYIYIYMKLMTNQDLEFSLFLDKWFRIESTHHSNLRHINS